MISVNAIIDNLNFENDFETGMVESPSNPNLKTQAVIIHSTVKDKDDLMAEVKASLRLKREIERMVEESPIELGMLKDLLRSVDKYDGEEKKDG